MKYCGKCKVKKPDHDFHKDRRTKSGLMSRCKDCVAEQHQTFAGKESQKKSNKRYGQTLKGKVTKCRGGQRYQLNHPEQGKARTAVSDAIKVEKLRRPSTCEECGLPTETQGHHPDYSKPLEVIWLCLKCHRNLHKQLKLEKSVGGTKCVLLKMR